MSVVETMVYLENLKDHTDSASAAKHTECTVDYVNNTVERSTHCDINETRPQQVQKKSCNRRVVPPHVAACGLPSSFREGEAVC